MAPGESVRVRYVAATRMVSVVRRGRAYDLAALPATSDISHMRFGVALAPGNAMRVTGASAGARRKCFRCHMCCLFFWSFHHVSHAARYLVPHVRFVARRVMCQGGSARGADLLGDIVAWLCERAPLWVVAHVCTLLRAY